MVFQLWIFLGQMRHLRGCLIHWDAQNLMLHNFGGPLGVEVMVSCRVGPGWIHGLQGDKGIRLEHPGQNNGS